MPKSKRSKQVDLTKIKKKGRSAKETLISKVQESLDEYKTCYALRHINMRSAPFLQVKADWEDSRFYVGKNKVMQIAFGRDESSSYKEHAWRVANHLKGHVMVLLTNRPKQEVLDYFKNYTHPEYAVAGAIASHDIILPIGTDTLKSFSHSMEGYFRQLGLPIKLDKGELFLYKEFQIAQQGQPLNVEQCKILKLLDIKMGKFYMEPICYWSTEGGFENLE
mmetsp:Transcript_4684/g.5290  ORF Transcript_4684/g.5290 Transcript_4684/m.5290 type:complete len:221 (+) Transcript_4684:86-748(+)|eukprot:CAMPEP_0115008116 /NCGR_PEP_ID=MMETSP0216-20121206/21685_1 /TAXON_ID=223996 /ORGANISM="Protocruzia adherens, Strain Boccale" /LENGTH=220 /DNA_ID=CAMNT_0002375391 /DNA_START=34 /DNA_END=696 /DNA_ORIENTATION=+